MLMAWGSAFSSGSLWRGLLSTSILGLFDIVYVRIVSRRRRRRRLRLRSPGRHVWVWTSWLSVSCLGRLSGWVQRILRSKRFLVHSCTDSSIACCCSFFQLSQWRGPTACAQMCLFFFLCVCVTSVLHFAEIAFGYILLKHPLACCLSLATCLSTTCQFNCVDSLHQLEAQECHSVEPKELYYTYVTYSL